MIYSIPLFILSILHAVLSDQLSITLQRQTLAWRFGKFAALDWNDPLQRTQFSLHNEARATHKQRLHASSANDNVEVMIYSPIHPIQSPIHPQDSDVFYHFLFTAEIGIGTPPQLFLAGIDLTWSDLFVPSVNCTLDPRVRDDCAPLRQFNSSLSTSYTTRMLTTELQYYMLETRGRVAYDTLHVGPWTIPQQGFEEAPYWYSWYPSWWNPMETVLGLARLPPKRSRSTMTEKSALHKLIEHKILDRNMFALSLPRTDYELGELILGGSDKRYHQSAVSIPITNVTKNTPNDVVYSMASCGWQVEVSEISLSSVADDKPSMNISLNGWIAIVSNSADYISVPVYILEQILQHLGLEDREDVDCNRLGDLPELTIAFGAYGSITLTAQQYFMEVQDQRKGTRCALVFLNWYFAGSPNDFEGWIVLGTPFLTHLHSVFDLDQKAISFAVRDET